jgi:3-oxoacyl-[acyl-carrier-protein] synthase-3
MSPISVTGLGSWLPPAMVGNADLPPLDRPATDAEIARLGVYTRGIASADESIPFMAAEAARAALADAGITAQDLDFFVLSNWTQRRFLPDFAPRVQALLGAPRAFAFDVSTACAGFAYGVGVARGFLQDPRLRRGLVVSAETTSRRARPRSRATLVFGDAAGAVVLERGEHGTQVLDVELATDGRQWEAMEVDADGHVVTHIEQKALHKLATTSFADASAAVLGRQGYTIADVDYVVPHSGTAGIQSLLVDTLGVPADRILTNFPTVGNVSSAAIPVALDAFRREGVLRPGHLVLCPTTGSGWYAAALLLRMGPC